MATFAVTIDGQSCTVLLNGDGTAMVNGRRHAVDIRPISAHEFSVLLDGLSVKIVLVKSGDTYQVLLHSLQHEVTVESERDLLLRRYARALPAAEGRTEIRAPMPALVVKIEVVVGQKVDAGQGLLVLEAMKMENELRAARAGQVKEIPAVHGKPVEKGELLMVLE